MKYYNSLLGLKHFSVRTKAVYHAFVEEMELRDFNYWHYAFWTTTYVKL